MARVRCLYRAQYSGAEFERDGRDAAGGIEMARHVMHQGGGDAHLRRWRRDVGIGFLAPAQRDTEGDHAHADADGGKPRSRNSSD